jgi:hypothetical protein
MAASMLDFRRARSTALPADLFGEPAWDLLLELFVADAKGQHLTGRDVSRRCNIPASVLSRWLIHLAKIDLIIGDGDGNLDDLLTLSGKALESVEQTMERAFSLQSALG